WAASGRAATTNYAWILGVGVLLHAAVAIGSVLCADKDGRVSIRHTCLVKEQPVSADELGSVGPPGPTGVQGPMGPRGPQGSPRQRDALDYLTPIGVLLSGGALFVSVLTLRAHQQRFEIEASPWLSGSSLEPQEVPVDEEPMRLKLDAYLVLKNVGRTPACALSIETEWAIESPEGKLLHSGTEPRRTGLTVAPADQHHQRLCRLPFSAFGQVGKIKTRICYTSAVGGKGEVRLSFIQRPAPRGGGGNAPHRYWFQPESPLSPATEAGTRRAMASAVPVLWQFRQSHYNEKARWALDWKRIRHERRSLLPGLHVPRVMWMT